MTKACFAGVNARLPQAWRIPCDSSYSLAQSTSHKRSLLSLHVAMTREPSGEKKADVTACELPVSATGERVPPLRPELSAILRASHSLTVLSLLEVRK